MTEIKSVLYLLAGSAFVFVCLFSQSSKVLEVLAARYSKDLIRRKSWEKVVALESIDILQLILQRLPISDYTAFRKVCIAWRDAVDHRAISTKFCSSALQPWLLVKDPDHTMRKHGYRVETYYIEHRSLVKSSKRHVQYLDESHYVGSIEGWLIITKKINLLERKTFFLNPVTHARVMLPDCYNKLTKVVASKAPAPTASKDCIVAVLTKSKDLAFCTPTDASWTRITTEKRDTSRGFFEDIEIIDGKLYAVDHESLKVFDIHRGDPPRYSTAETLVVLSDLDNLFRVQRWSRLCRFCLVKDAASKELFMVLIRVNHPITTEWRVFKLESKIKRGAGWAEVYDLGDRVMFLSGPSNYMFVHDKNLTKNCIYFAFGRDPFQSPFGVYSMADRCIKQLPFWNHPSSIGEHLHAGIESAIWFTPHPW